MEFLRGWIVDGPAGAAVGSTAAAYNWAMMDIPFVSATELLRKARPGDLIEFERETYRHWAMYLERNGNDANIMKVPSENKHNTHVAIKKDSLLSVAGTSKVRVNNQERTAGKLRLPRRSPADAVAAAKADEGNTFTYNYLHENCEYYSTGWLYEEGFSVQVRNATNGLPATGFAAQCFGITGGIVGGLLGGPWGAFYGYSGVRGGVGAVMSACFEPTGATHYIP